MVVERFAGGSFLEWSGAGFLHGSQLNELSSPGDKILKFLLVLRCFGCEWGLDELGELSEIAASDGSVLARCPSPLAKSLACRGLTTATVDWRQ